MRRDINITIKVIDNKKINHNILSNYFAKMYNKKYIENRKKKATF